MSHLIQILDYDEKNIMHDKSILGDNPSDRTKLEQSNVFKFTHRKDVKIFL